jgi:iron complex transport system ATP-binding protein
MSTILQIENLSFAYEKSNIVLNDLSLKIQKGSINAVLGRNGCGKSTLLDCIINFNQYEEGTILLNGRNIRDFSNKELARNISYISQSTIINMNFTVKEFISFGRNPYLKLGSSPSKEDYIKVSFIAKKCGVEHLLEKHINKISGGERQLVFICRALVQETEVLIFDEPTASLDFGNQYKLFDLLKLLQKEGKTIIFTTHNPNQVLELDSNVIVLGDGKILCNGKASEVLNATLLEKIYDYKFIKENNVFRYSKDEKQKENNGGKPTKNIG